MIYGGLLITTRCTSVTSTPGSAMSATTRSVRCSGLAPNWAGPETPPRRLQGAPDRPSGLDGGWLFCSPRAETPYMCPRSEIGW